MISGPARRDRCPRSCPTRCRRSGVEPTRCHRSRPSSTSSSRSTTRSSSSGPASIDSARTSTTGSRSHARSRSPTTRPPTGRGQSPPTLSERLAPSAPVHLDEKGRGLALRRAWSQSDSEVVAYMDVDLSTDLDALLPLVAPLVSGHSDVAIGSRLAPGAAVARGPKREAISRTYNLILRTMFATQVRDMQCGFKAVRRDVAAALLPAVEDNAWFFDTELLCSPSATACASTRSRSTGPTTRTVASTSSAPRSTTSAVPCGSRRPSHRGRGRVDVPRTRAELADDFGRRLVSFALIGALSTVATIAVFLAARAALGPIGANCMRARRRLRGEHLAQRALQLPRRTPRWRPVTVIFVATLAVLDARCWSASDAAGGGVVAEVLALVAVWGLAGAARCPASQPLRAGSRPMTVLDAPPHDPIAPAAARGAPTRRRGRRGPFGAALAWPAGGSGVGPARAVAPARWDRGAVPLGTVGVRLGELVLLGRGAGRARRAGRRSCSGRPTRRTSSPSTRRPRACGRGARRPRVRRELVEHPRARRRSRVSPPSACST